MREMRYGPWARPCVALAGALLFAGCASSSRARPSSQYATQAQGSGEAVTVSSTSDERESRYGAQPDSPVSVGRSSMPQAGVVNAVPGSASTPTRPRVSEEPPRQPTAQSPAPPPPPASPAPVAPGGGGSGGVPSGPPRSSQEAVEAQIQRWQGALTAAQQQLVNGLEECRDICAAAGNVCRASEEICRLTGDETPGLANVRDPRCRRAREACVDASRQRDGHCPACPAPH